VFATVVGLGLTGLTVGSALNAPIALAKGANETGPYDPTPTSAPPCENNQGNGNAPCNGTVGKADDKNPPGQLPGGSDNNNGYECDGNHGVGNDGGNPAHTGCTDQPGEEGGNNPGGNNQGGLNSSSGTGSNGEVLALTESAPLPGTPSSGAVAGETVTAPATQAAAATTSPGQLAFTGPGTLTYLLAGLGALLLLLGMVLVRATKEPAFA
jgi:hypothetical protein